MGWKSLTVVPLLLAIGVSVANAQPKVCVPATAAVRSEGIPLCGTLIMAMLDRTTCSERLASRDAVVLTKLIRVTPRRSQFESPTGTFEIIEILKGEDRPGIRVGGRIDTPVYNAKVGETFVLERWRQDSWDITSARNPDYYRQLLALPAGPERLAFFLPNLGVHDEFRESYLERDARLEFRHASYADLLKLRPHLQREEVRKKLKELQVHFYPRTLHYLLLGICGNEDDARWIEQELKGLDPRDGWTRVSMLTCYLAIRGEAGLGFIQESYLDDPQRTADEVYAATWALRFHARETDAIPRERLVAIFQTLLKREAFAAYAVEGLASCEDWSLLEGIRERFLSATPDQEKAGLRVMLIHYLRKCPLARAKPILAEFERINPKAAQDPRSRPETDKFHDEPPWERSFFLR